MWYIARCTALLDKSSPIFLVREFSNDDLLLKSISSLLNAHDLDEVLFPSYWLLGQ